MEMDGSVLSEELKSRCLSLVLEDRMELASLLVRSVEGERRETELMSRGAGVLKSLFGIDVRCRNRSRDVVDVRTMFCYRMRGEGMFFREIGDFVGIDHSTVMHHCSRMSDALRYPRMFSDLVRKYEMFNQEL